MYSVHTGRLPVRTMKVVRNVPCVPCKATYECGTRELMSSTIFLPCLRYSCRAGCMWSLPIRIDTHLFAFSTRTARPCTHTTSIARRSHLCMTMQQSHFIVCFVSMRLKGTVVHVLSTTEHGKSQSYTWGHSRTSVCKCCT